MNVHIIKHKRSGAVAVCLLILAGVLFSPASAAACDCTPLAGPGPGESTATVGDASELQTEINNAAGPKTIYLRNGVYHVNTGFWITVTKPDITIRSLSGNRDDVVIQGAGMGPAPGFGIQVYDSGATIADLTIRDVAYHAIQVVKTAGKQTDDTLFHNIRCVDSGQQLFKSSGGAMSNGVIRCSTFEYTTTLKAHDHNFGGWYTNGIDLVSTHGWTIQDNVIRNIKHDPAATATLAGPAILVWPAQDAAACTDTIIERNRIIDCDMGIFFGNSSSSIVNHTGGVIRNNFIKGHAGSDVGIGLVRSVNAKVLHNTVYSPGGATNWSIEARFSETTGCRIMNNLTDETIWGNRDGASSTLTANFTGAEASHFVNAAGGALHLASGSDSRIVDAAQSTPDRTADIECEAVVDSLPDIGADEYIAPASVEWTGSESADWNDPDNWSGAETPGPSAEAAIPDVSGSGGFFPVLSASPASGVRGLTVAVGASFQSDANAGLAIAEHFSISGLVTILGSIQVGGR